MIKIKQAQLKTDTTFPFELLWNYKYLFENVFNQLKKKEEGYDWSFIESYDCIQNKCNIRLFSSLYCNFVPNFQIIFHCFLKIRLWGSLLSSIYLFVVFMIESELIICRCHRKYVFWWKNKTRQCLLSLYFSDVFLWVRSE